MKALVTPGVHPKTYGQTYRLPLVDRIFSINSPKTFVNGRAINLEDDIMSTLLPATDYFKKEAKALLKNLQDEDPTSLAVAKKVFPSKDDFGLMNAQHILALKYGFKSWTQLESASPIEQRLALTMEKNPMLCADGWGVSDFNSCYKVSISERADAFNKALELERAELRLNFKAVEQTFEWILENMVPTKSFNLDSTSYGLKHRAEHDIGYIINGVFIAAALIAGYKVKTRDRSINVYFNMSKKAIRETYRRQNHSNKRGGTLMIRLEESKLKAPAIS